MQFDRDKILILNNTAYTKRSNTFLTLLIARVYNKYITTIVFQILLT